MHCPISDELRAQLSALHGVSADDVFAVACKATIVPASADETERALVAHYATEHPETAGGPSMVSNGVPTVMRIVAWMCHEGFNDNGLGFVREELPAAAAKIKAPNLLVMDWNHAAVLQYPGEQRLIGVWYKADYAFDPKALDGAGAWGILVTGVMFAWANPEIATTMLAEQERNGALDFSMACIGTSTEYVPKDGRMRAIAHNPIFFTNSALDVRPADKDAVGHGVEGSDSATLEDDLAARLTGLPPDTEVPALDRIRQLQVDAAAARTTTQEDALMDELKQQLAALAAQLTGMTAEKDTAVAALAAQKAEFETTIAGLTAQLDAARAEFAAKPLDATTEQLSVAKDALETQVTDLTAQLTAVKADLATATEQLAVVAATKAADEKQAKLETRLASLPASVKAAYEKRSPEAKKTLEESWLAKSDAEWAFYTTEELAVISTAAAHKVGYVERSKLGVLPINIAGSEGTEGSAATSDEIVAKVRALKK